MSIKVMTWAWEQPFSGNDKLVLLALADNADEDRHEAWPSLSTVARKTGASVRTVRRILRELEKAGIVSTKIQQGGLAGTPEEVRPNLYKIHMDWTPGQDDPPVKMTPRSPMSGDPRSSATEPPDTDVRLTVIEPSVEQSAAEPQPTTGQTADTIVKWFCRENSAAKIHAVRDAVTAHLKEGREPSEICRALARFGTRRESALISRASLQIEMNGGFQRRETVPRTVDDPRTSLHDRSPDEVLW